MPRFEEAKKHSRQSRFASDMLQFRKRTTVFQSSLVQQTESIGKAFCFIQSVRADDDSLAFGLEMLNEFKDDLTAHDVEASRWFVEEHHRRIVN